MFRSLGAMAEMAAVVAVATAIGLRDLTNLMMGGVSCVCLFGRCEGTDLV
jgi:hypothetical protein